MPRTYLAAMTLGAALLQGCTGQPSIEGKYRDPNGSTVELLADGTAVIIINGTQAVWKWTTYDGDRLKFEPGAGLLGAPAAVCDYALNADVLKITGCEYAMRLTRL